MELLMQTTVSHKWSAADTVTALRIVLAIPLLFLSPQSLWFLCVYTLAGLTDALDGFLARKSGTAGDFGARLDSIADLSFYGIMFIRCLPLLFRTLPRFIWYGVAAALVLRVAAYATAAIKYHRFASLHTWLNKLTGAAVFLLPYGLALSQATVFGLIACMLAFAASLEELLIHLCCKEYHANSKSVFALHKAEN